MAIITVTIKPELDGEPKGRFKYQVGGSAASRVFASVIQQLAMEDKRTIGKTKKFVKAGS